MCAYQEAAKIGEALASLKRAGCERLVVVDGAWRWFPRYGEGPGSTDETVEIARAAGAEVIEAPTTGWDSEVAARNSYLVGKPGDWYLVLDADERAHGSLPEQMDAPEGAYQVWVRMTADAMADVRRVRLVQEDGTLRYQYGHFALYRDGRLLEQAALLDTLWIEHDQPGDVDRAQRKVTWYQRAGAQERAYLIDGRPPARAVEEHEMDTITYRYTGAGAWIPGVPARDLLAHEAATLAETLEANLRSARPIYERVLSTAELTEAPAEAAVEVVPDAPVEAEPAPQRRRRNQESD